MKGRKLYRRKWRLSGLLAFFLAFFLTAAVASASESDRMPDIDGGQELSLIVTMTYTDPNLEEDNVITMSGVEVCLVQVASLAVNGGSADYTLLEAFAGSGIGFAGMTASESSKAAEILAALVAEGGENSSADIKTAATDSEGKAVFTGLEAGMYLIFQEEGANAAYRVDAVMAMLISVPYPQITTDGNSWIYTVETYPKTELSGPKNNGSITVTKAFYDTKADMTYYPPEDEKIVFYVGLFTDEACTQRTEGTTDLPVTFLNSSSASVTFENLMTDQTYYIAETDGSGNVLSSVTRVGTIFYPAYPEGQAVTITSDEPDASISFRNTTSGLPDRYYYGGTLTITKRTLYGEEDYITTGTYYAGIFADAEFTALAGDVVALNLNNESSVSVDVRIYFGEEVTDSVTCYVTETDENGTPLSNDSDLGFIISLSKEGGKVTLDSENAKDEIVIMNSFEKIEIETEIETEPGWDLETESESNAQTGQSTETESDSGSAAGETDPPSDPSSGETEPETEGKTAVTSTPQTGDGTPLAQTITIMAAALIILLVQVRRMQSRK